MSANEHDDDQPDSFEVIERLRARVAKLEEALKTARAYIRSTMKLVHRQRAQETIKAIDAALAAEGAVEAMRAKCEAIARSSENANRQEIESSACSMDVAEACLQTAAHIADFIAALKDKP